MSKHGDIKGSTKGDMKGNTKGATNVVQIMDYRPDPIELRLNFRPWHVEALLNQAADLIDKCLGELREYSSLVYSWNQFQIDLRAQQEELDEDKKRAGYIEGVLPPSGLRQGYFGRDLVIAEARQTFFTQSRPAFDSARAHTQQLYTHWSNNLDLREGQAAHISAGQNSSEKEVENLERTMNEGLTNQYIAWATSDMAYNKHLLDLRSKALASKRELSNEKGPLALEWQSGLVFSRVKQNYEDALNRACVAKVGLDKFYGYKGRNEIPPPPTEPTGNPVELDVTNLAIWIRTSIAWLVAYQQLDQAFTRVVSVRSLLTEDTWEELTSAEDRFSISVMLPAELFANHENVRMRGVGASLLGEAGSVPWTLIIGLPKKAVYQRLTESEKVDQDDLPTCLLGRVENRRVPRPLEISGLISLMNASPIGQATSGGSWSLEIIRPVATSEKFSAIADMLLEINAVGRPK